MAEIGFRAKIMLTVNALMVVAIIAVSLGGLYTVQSQIEDQVLNRQETSLRVLIDGLRRTGESVSVVKAPDGTISSITMERIPTFEDHAMIDNVGAVTGETATIFAWEPENKDFRRMSTNIIKPDGQRAVGTVLGEKSAAYAPTTSGKAFKGEAVILGKSYYTIYQPIIGPAGTPIGIAYVGVFKEDFLKSIADLRLTFVIVGAISIVVAVLLVWLALSRQMRPLGTLVGLTQQLASGDTQCEVPFTTKKDDIGEIARAVDLWRTTMEDSETLRAEQEREREEAETARSAVLAEIADSIEGEIGEVANQLRDSASGMTSSVNNLTSTIETVRSQSTNTESSSAQTANSVQTVAVAAEELRASSEEIARQMEATNGLIERVTGQASDAEQRIGGLKSAADEIGAIINLITEIAEQTNLLALNATIEAARAGEAGKGFAVVASEVKNLANQTAKATDDISRQVQSIQGETDAAVGTVSSIVEAIAELNETANTVSSTVEQQGSATSEIARSIDAASAAAKEVAGAAAVMLSEVEKNSTASQSVADGADNVLKLSDDLRGRATKMVTRLRA